MADVSRMDMSGDGAAAPSVPLARPGWQVVALVVITVLSFFTLHTLATSGLLPRFVLALVIPDSSGIILTQLGAFVGFVLLASAQTWAGSSELRSLLSERPVGKTIQTAVGLPSGWADALARRDVNGCDRPALERVLDQHADARLGLLRVLLAAFPTSGFIGTVLGVRQAIAPLDELAAGGDTGAMSSALGTVVSGLELAFNTTLVGLVLALVGSFALFSLTAFLRRVHGTILQTW